MTADLRVLRAVAMAEALLDGRRVRPSWAVARAAAVQGVDRLAVACALLDKLVACQRARSTIAGIEESELIEQPPARNPRPKRADS